MPKKTTYSTPKKVITDRLDRAGNIGGKKGGGKSNSLGRNSKKPSTGSKKKG